MQKLKLVFAGVLLFMLLSGCSQPQTGTENTQASIGNADNRGIGSMTTATVSNGDTIKVDYTGKLTDGKVFDSSEGKAPLEFTVGGGNMIQGFDEAVIGMKLNEEKTVTIPPEKAYGPIIEEAFIWVPKANIQGDANITIGSELTTATGMQVTVVDMNADSVKINANHQLAGKTLVFDIKVVDINKATS